MIFCEVLSQNNNFQDWTVAVREPYDVMGNVN